MGAAIRAMQRASARELAARRAAVVEAVSAVAPLRFVNGGGTGSVERTAAEPAVTEVAAGSGLYGPTLFDAYTSFSPEPAALFALPVVRRPDARTATALGGGYPASGAAGADRLPVAAPARRACGSTGRRARARSRRRCAARAPRRCASATWCGCGTPRRASCASGSTRCTWCAVARWSTRCRRIGARASASCRTGERQRRLGRSGFECRGGGSTRGVALESHVSPLTTPDRTTARRLTHSHPAAVDVRRELPQTRDPQIPPQRPPVPRRPTGSPPPRTAPARRARRRRSGRPYARSAPRARTPSSPPSRASPSCRCGSRAPCGRGSCSPTSATRPSRRQRRGHPRRRRIVTQ